MPLYNTWTKALIEPNDVESLEIMQTAIKKIPQKSRDKMNRTIDEALDNLKPSNKSKLIWTKAGAL